MRFSLLLLSLTYFHSFLAKDLAQDTYDSSLKAPNEALECGNEKLSEDDKLVSAGDSLRSVRALSDFA